MNRIFITAFAIVFSTFTFFYSSNIRKIESKPQKNEAGKCRMPSFEEAYGESEAVFIGEVLSAEKKGDDKVFKFRVEKYWKGNGEREVQIRVYESTRFQAWFKTGEKYLVFANADEEGILRDYARCSRSKELENASDDVEKLGEAKRPK